MTGTGVLRVPPGRAGILALRRRLAGAEAGAGLLTRKLAVLSVEADRLDALAAETGRVWHEAAVDAQRLLDLAAQLGGDRVIRLATVPAPAQFEVRRTTLMGVSYPDSVRCAVPDRLAESAPSPGAALFLAVRALGEAVPAAARHAAASHAATVVQREVALTRQRLRALEHHRIPALREALARVVRQTEELESADALLRRWGSAESVEGAWGRAAVTPWPGPPVTAEGGHPDL